MLNSLCRADEGGDGRCTQRRARDDSGHRRSSVQNVWARVAGSVHRHSPGAVLSTPVAQALKEPALRYKHERWKVPSPPRQRLKEGGPGFWPCV